MNQANVHEELFVLTRKVRHHSVNMNRDSSSPFLFAIRKQLFWHCYCWFRPGVHLYNCALLPGQVATYLSLPTAASECQVQSTTDVRSLSVSVFGSVRLSCRQGRCCCAAGDWSWALMRKKHKEPATDLFQGLNLKWESCSNASFDVLLYFDPFTALNLYEKM